ncbi:MAG: DUF805 domain-containing protein [Mycobacterium sp.]
MTLTEAVKDGFAHYVDFNGRASRSAYWWWFLFAILLAVAVSAMDGTIFEESMLLTLFVWLGLILPSLSVAIRRLHDTDRSGWWILISFIPIIGFIVLLVFHLQQGDPIDNRYGSPPREGIAATT